MLPAAFYSRHNVDLIESQSVRCHGLPLRVISSKHVLQAKHYEPIFIDLYPPYRHSCAQNMAIMVASVHIDRYIPSVSIPLCPKQGKFGSSTIEDRFDILVWPEMVKSRTSDHQNCFVTFAAPLMRIWAKSRTSGKSAIADFKK